ncbi:MAG: glycosyltransferase [Gammaproteobacteria bacterium]|nr:glycosyltransferase [Gammaproteobacteria bacterium]
MLMEDCFGWVDYWKRALEKHGYAVWDLIGNAEMLQKVWSKEHGINYAEDNWLKEIVAAQITHYKPEVLFVNDYNIYPASFLRQIRQNCTSIKLVVGWCGAPYRDAGIFSECDIVLTNIARVVEDLRGAGVVAEKMHHAFAPILLDRVNRNKDALSDFVFIGSVFLQDKFHIKRAQILADLLETTDIEIWGQVGAAGLNAKAKGKPGIRGLVRKIYEGMNGKRGNGEFTEDDKQNVLKLRAHIRSPVYGLQMFEKLHNSRITFNSHIDISLNESSNMRLFEATGVGSCLMTENSKNITEIFDPDTEVVTYENATDAAEKVVYLLENEDLRKRIAGAGQRRTLRDHNFDVRAQAMNELIRVRLA